jgi:hypothetical protein
VDSAVFLLQDGTVVLEIPQLMMFGTSNYG